MNKSAQETTYWTTMQGWVGWSESSVSAENNTSKVTVTLQCHKSANYKTTGTWAYSIYINGSCAANSSWYGQIGSDWVTLATASATVPHNADGSKTVEIYAYIQAPGSTSLAGKSSSGTGYAALSTIPRASTIGATDANIGSASVIAVTKMTSGYTHSIAYSFGSLSGYLDADGALVSEEVKISATSLSVTLPAAWYAQIPNAKSGVCTLTCKTYSGDTQIGDAKTASFTVTASETLCAPSVSGAITDTNSATVALTGDASKLVRYASTARLTITATAKNSASIASKRIAGQTPEDNVLVIEAVEGGSFSFQAADSRGYASQVTVTASVVEYVRLTNNAVAKRSDATSGKVALSLSGSCFGGSFGAVSNVLNAKYRTKPKGGTWGGYTTLAPTVSAAGYSQNVELTGLTYTSEWVIEVTVSDKLMSKTVEIAVGKGIPIANWGEDFWQFNVNMKMANADGDTVELTPAALGKLVWLASKSAQDLFSAVGAIYISAVETSPASLFGGTWERIKDTFLLAAGDTYAAGATGGEAAHKLTTSEMPSHNHYIGDVSVWTNGDGSISSSTSGKYGYWKSSTNYTGGSAEHNNMPPYLTVYVWKRVA